MDPSPRRTIIFLVAGRYSQAQPLAQSKTISRSKPDEQQNQGIGQEEDSGSDSLIHPVQQRRPLFVRPGTIIALQNLPNC